MKEECASCAFMNDPSCSVRRKTNDETERQLPRAEAADGRAVLRSGGQQFAIDPSAFSPNAVVGRALDGCDIMFGKD